MLQLNHMAHELDLAQHTTFIPRTLKEVLRSDAKDKWLTAMQDEICALTSNDTFELVDLPPGRKAISTCWVLKLKAAEVYKAHWVACGFSQKAGIDFNDTCACCVA